MELVGTNVDSPKGHQIGQLFGLNYHKAQDKTPYPKPKHW
jgi:hypothetical protein